MPVLLVLLFLMAGCGGDKSPNDTGVGSLTVDDPDTGRAGDGDGGPGDVSGDDSGGAPPGPSGFIGSPCSVDSDCEYDDGVCLTDGFPDGMCSVQCDLYCPDQDGAPVTFCVDGSTFEDPTLSGGWCVSRCDFDVFSGEGCRDEYGCTVQERHGEPETQNFSCIPGAESDLNSCHYELADRGIAFEPTVRAVDHPDGYPELDCIIEDPVWILSPVFGVEMKYYDGSVTERTLAACEMAHAVGDTIEDVVDAGVTALLHIGTYNCRNIAGTSDISRHGYADAIDIYGFEFDGGEVWTLIDDWEHDTETPTTDAGRFLYEAAYRWYEDYIWNIILTPNYNAGHDNHFHVDLSPGSHYVGMTDGRFIGPAPYAD